MLQLNAGFTSVSWSVLIVLTGCHRQRLMVDKAWFLWKKKKESCTACIKINIGRFSSLFQQFFFSDWCYLFEVQWRKCVVPRTSPKWLMLYVYDTICMAEKRQFFNIFFFLAQQVLPPCRNASNFFYCAIGLQCLLILSVLCIRWPNNVLRYHRLAWWSLLF